MPLKSKRLVRVFVGTCCALAWLLITPAGAGEWFDLNGKTLASFDFEGMALPDNVAELKQQYPDAHRDQQRVDEQVGLECYKLSDLKNADVARFYFCDDRLYQVEIVYELPRVKKLGGMQALVHKLIDTWGPADHVGQRRWTWLRLMYNRRADFYTWPDAAQLTITDVTWMPTVALRQKRLDDKQPPDLGF
jgi:hypothetical protein